MTRDHVLSSRLSFFQSCSFYLRLRRPPRQPLFPYTTLFRSEPTAHPAKGSLPLTRRNWRPVAAKSPVSPPLRLPVLRRRACHRSEEHTSELQSRGHLVCRLLLEKQKSKCRADSNVQHFVNTD